VIPQSTPLYAVGHGDDCIDLLLVVGWKPLGNQEADPYVVFLGTTGDSTPRGACVPRADPDRMWHHHLAYFDNREDAEADYEAALAEDSAKGQS
jgi:hypothetical protein